MKLVVWKTNLAVRFCRKLKKTTSFEFYRFWKGAHFLHQFFYTNSLHLFFTLIFLDLFFTPFFCFFYTNFLHLFFTSFFCFFYTDFFPKNIFQNFKIWCKKAKFLGVEKNKNLSVKKSKIFGVKKKQKFWCKKIGVKKSKILV